MRWMFGIMAVGLAIGIPAALATGKVLSSKLYAVTGHDLLVLGSASIVIAVAAILSAIVPARRAASIDPMKALRTE